MTREEWENYEGFERMKREMNGVFAEWPAPPEAVGSAEDPHDF